MQKMNKSELRNVVRSAVKDFIHAHPEALEPKWIESVTKRVTGQVYCHFVHNKEKNNGVTVVSGNVMEGVPVTEEMVKGLGCMKMIND